MSIKRILSFTSIRSDYDLLSGLYKRLHQDPSIDFQLLVSGAHLSPTFGYTVKQIEGDGLPILARIESLIDSNSAGSRLKTASNLLHDCIHTVQAFDPDLITFAGDREDAICVALVGAYLKIPTVHFFGGDHAVDGHVDNPIRHACSKLATAHFTIHPQHSERLLKMGESKERIFQIGSPALDKFIHEPRQEKKKLLEQLQRPEWKTYALMIFHPIFGQEESAGQYFEDILVALKQKKWNAFVSAPNTDAGSRSIISVIDKYKDDKTFCFYKNLDRPVFINLMRNASFMIGNSSSGLLEAPSVPLAAINVGTRQRGRKAAENVLFVEQKMDAIFAGIDTVLSPEFQDQVKSVRSPFGDGTATDQAFDLIKTTPFQKMLLKTEDPLHG